jgi:hypothetical protein
VAFVDKGAGHVLREMREERGLGSPEALAQDLRLKAKTAPWGERGCVDAWTLRQIERKGRVPGVRIQFVLANYFGVDRREIWVPGRQEVAA